MGKITEEAHNMGGQRPIIFKRGLPGLEGCEKFALHGIKDNPFFYYLQSLDEPQIGLILLDPFPLFPEYSFDLGDADKQELQLQAKEDLLVLTTVTVKKSRQMTTNLAAPLLINCRDRLAKQIIIPEKAEQLQTPLPAE